jgi:hypothetical protein
MISKKTLLNGAIILLVCLACALPAGALELNPLSYILKQPVPVQTVNKTLVNHALGSPVEKVTVLPQVTSGVSFVDAPTMSQVHSGTDTCTPDTSIIIHEGTITEIKYAHTEDTPWTVMKLSGGSEIVLFAAPGGNRDRVNHLFETAYIKGNRIYVTTRNECWYVSFTGYDGTNKQYRAYNALVIYLGPVHP